MNNSFRFLKEDIRIIDANGNLVDATPKREVGKRGLTQKGKDILKMLISTDIDFDKAWLTK